MHVYIRTDPCDYQPCHPRKFPRAPSWRILTRDSSLYTFYMTMFTNVCSPLEFMAAQGRLHVPGFLAASVVICSALWSVNRSLMQQLLKTILKRLLLCLCPFFIFPASFLLPGTQLLRPLHWTTENGSPRSGTTVR